LPGLLKAGQQAATLWTSGQKVWGSARSWMKSWTSGTSGGKEPIQVQGDKVPSGVVDAPPAPMTEVEGHERGLQEKDHEDEEGHEEVVRKPLWGPCECCISCVSAAFSLNPEMMR
jgi:hypothetical protein